MMYKQVLFIFDNVCTSTIQNIRSLTSTKIYGQTDKQPDSTTFGTFKHLNKQNKNIKNTLVPLLVVRSANQIYMN